MTCGNSEGGLAPALGPGPMAQVWSQWMLAKGFFDPIQSKSYKLHLEQSEPPCILSHARPRCLRCARGGQGSPCQAG